MTIGRLVGDRLTSAWGAEALVRRGGLLSAAGIAGALLIGDPIAATAGFALVGFGIARWCPWSSAPPSEVDGRDARASASPPRRRWATSASSSRPPIIGAIAEVDDAADRAGAARRS